MLVAFLILGAAMVSLMLWGRGELIRFLRDHAQIAGETDLRTFKALARRNMIGALVMMGLGFVWFPLGLYLMITEVPGGMAAFAIAGVLFGLLGMNGKRMEAASRALPCEEALRQEYDRVGQNWVKKALPDF